MSTIFELAALRRDAVFNQSPEGFPYSVYFKFYNSEGLLIDLDSFPTSDDFELYLDTTLVVETSLVISKVAIGVYSVDFKAPLLAGNFYKARLYGKIGGVESVIEGVFRVNKASALDSFAIHVRTCLYDDDPSLYLLDAKVSKFPKKLIYNHLLAGLNWINFRGPFITNYTMENIPVWNILLSYAQGHCLRSLAILEASNTFSYSDEYGITINREALYAGLAKDLLTEAELILISFKKTLRPTPYGAYKAIRSAKFPYMRQHILAMLPGFSQNSFV